MPLCSSVHQLVIFTGEFLTLDGLEYHFDFLLLGIPKNIAYFVIEDERYLSEKDIKSCFCECPIQQKGACSRGVPLTVI